MSSPLFRKLCALSGAVVLSAVGLGAPAFADPGDDRAGEQSPTGPRVPGAESTAERIPVIVMMKDQPSSPSATAEKGNLRAQDALISDWTEAYGIELDSQFGFLVNGFSATIPEDQMSALATEPEVSSVRRERIYEQTEHTARVLQGVPAAFEDHGTDGTGTVISIIDSGIDTSHQDMRLDSCGDAKIQKIDPAPEAGFTCKVPTGYNYADENHTVKDTTASQHGMHVAGIAAANGSAGDDADDVLETGRVDGAAPNAQLLAMKVFSNRPEVLGAQDSDIIAAIEDSVKLDADVINMSLGSSNGFRNASDGTAIAIDKAREAGVVTVVAAGNDGQNFSTTGVDDDIVGQLDDGTVGAPSTQANAFTVASVDNTVNTDFVAYYDDGADNAFPYTAATGTLDEAEHPIVDVGLGRPQDVPEDLGGDWALIERGEISFAEKYQNAIDAGAGGIIVFNSEANGDAPFGMAGVDDFDVPGITTGHSHGIAMREALEDGEVTVRISEDVQISDSPTGLEPSSFTSWGTTPTLDFAPEIAGIGGSVYSTYNDNTYGTNSGTSMASPNIAGLVALMIQDQNTDSPDVSGPERVDNSVTALMNTAEVLENDEGIPYSPRQVGAGLGRVDRALDTEVLATVDGEPSVALREIDGERSFTVSLSNSSDEVRRYSVPAQRVLMETNVAGERTTVQLGGGTLSTSATEVEVPANGTAEVTFTLTPSGGDDHFVGGWAQFTSATAGEPDLAIPYLGFDGDWNAEQILTPAGEELVPGLGVTTQLIGGADGVSVPLAQADGELWLSPNDDAYLDSISSQLAFQRNAGEVRYEILTEDGTPVKTLGEEQRVYRTILGDYVNSADPQGETWNGTAFDGYVWDAQAAEFMPAPDGRYIYRVSSRLSEGEDWQQTDIPFGLDATAPGVAIGELEGTTLPVTVTEEGSGLLEPPTAIAADGTALQVTALDAGRFTVEIPDPDAVPFITVSAVDRGLGYGEATAILSGDALVVPDAETLGAEGSVIGESSDLVTGGVLDVYGFVSDSVTSVEVNGEPAEVSEGLFSLGVPLAEGANEIVVSALGEDGSELGSVTYTVVYDGTPPEITLDDGIADESGMVEIGDGGDIDLSGLVADEREGAELGLTVDGIDVELAEDGTFATSVTPSETQSAVVLAATDGAGTGTLTLPIAGRDAPGAPVGLGFAITNADCRLPASGACFVSGSSPDASDDGTSFTVKGEVDPSISEVVFTSERRTDDAGEWTGEEEFPATITEDGTFSAELPMQTGENHYRLEVRDDEGASVLDMGLAFFFDVTAPTLQVDEPTLHGGTLFTSSEQVRFSGTAQDDGWGYAFSLNDSVVTEIFQDSSFGPDVNERRFEHDLTVADGDNILIQHQDANGNALIGIIPVIIDQIAPEVEVEGVVADQSVSRDHEATAVATDDNLASLRVSIDGEVVAEESTDLVAEEVAVQDVLIDAREFEEDEGTQPDEGTNPDGDAAPEADAAPEDDATAAEGPDAEEAPEEEPAPVQESDEPQVTTTAVGTRAAASSTELSAPVDLSELENGQHMITVESTDLAGNVTAQSIPFSVVSDLEVTGPETVNITLNRADLADQDAIEALVLAKGWTVALDGEPMKEPELSIVAGTVLVEGENTVMVIATGPDGQTAWTTVSVILELEEYELRDGDVSAISTFSRDDQLNADLEKTTGGTLLTVSNGEQFASLPSLISVPAGEGTTVVRILSDGTRVEIPSSWKDGTLSFHGPSKGQYLLVAPAGGSGGDGDGGAPGGDPVPGPGAGNGGGAGDGTDGTTGGSSAGQGGPSWMPRTGVDIAGAVLLAVMLLGSGFVLLRWGHRDV